MRTAAALLLSMLALIASAGPGSGQEAHLDAGGSAPAVIDGHADFAIHYLRRGWSVDAHDIETSLPGSVDVPRWRAGGVGGMLVTIGSDLPPGSTGHFPRVLRSIDWFEALIRRHERSLAPARSSRHLEDGSPGGRIALMLAIEGGEQLDASLDNVRTAYARGVRSVGIVYDHHNAIGDGAMAMSSSAAIAGPAHGGLTPFGREVIAELNRLGMIIDLSHAAETTALEAIGLSRAPVIFSHSGARALADTPRNLADEVLRRVAANGGIVMVTFAPYLTTTEHWRWWSEGEARYAELVAAHGEDEAAIGRGMAEWDKANPQPRVGVGQVADQVEYVARMAGVDHVGIGSDFDGIGDFAVTGLGDAAGLPALFDELRRRGWSDADLAKLARENFLRVVRAVEAASTN